MRAKIVFLYFFSLMYLSSSRIALACTPPAVISITYTHLLKYTLCICRVLTRYLCRRNSDVLNRVDHAFLRTHAVLLQALDGLNRYVQTKLTTPSGATEPLQRTTFVSRLSYPTVEWVLMTGVKGVDRRAGFDLVK